jgi:type II secretory pathway component PulC
MMKLWLFSKQLPNMLWMHARFDKKNALPRTASIVAMSYLGWVIATWSNVLAINQHSNTATAVEAVNDNQTSPMPDYRQIADWRLLGETQVTAEANSTETSVVPTPLQLKLVGTFYLSQQPQNSYAVIQSAEGTQKKYRLGEPLQDGVSLHAVEKNRVVLMHNQRQEYLAFDPNTLALLTPKD